MPTLLVIDDEPNIAYSIETCLATDTLKVVSAATAKKGIQMVRDLKPDAVLCDVRLPDMSGLEAYQEIKRFDPRVPVIIITAYARTETAIEAMRTGAFEYLLKPVDFARLEEVIGKALEMSRLNRIPALMGSEPADLSADHIVGNSQAMQDVYKTIGRLAPQNVPVLILGESGTGKELVARAIYHYSQRGTKPFLAINCAALPETLLESELFGHERGAFTGADTRRIGKFEQVNGGTIFLDEIGDMSPATQAKALRLLQQQQFERVGGNQTVETDVRIITATNRDLTGLVEAGRYRRDLFYRLNGFTIHLPPLRERLEDIPLLAEHFIQLNNRDLKKNVRGLTADAMEILRRHNWPGNVREFQSAIKFAMVKTAGEILTLDCLPDSCRVGNPAEARPEAIATSVARLDVQALTQQLLATDEPDVYDKICHAVDRVVLEEVLKFVHHNQQKAAERLGISRMTLRSKLRGLGLLLDKNASSETTEPTK
ncbi:MAG: Two-component system, NtrC family, nitrogen regulation response regulator GlnG [Planctomycetaceae bacterium]|nr:Two-component system, NtrC family, nitrogen regulation response regulator GlnG [Planctomycetaceae bacterium]